jgi:hypothetical protein
MFRLFRAGDEPVDGLLGEELIRQLAGSGCGWKSEPSISMEVAEEVKGEPIMLLSKLK